MYLLAVPAAVFLSLHGSQMSLSQVNNRWVNKDQDSFFGGEFTWILNLREVSAPMISIELDRGIQQLSLGI